VFSVNGVWPYVSGPKILDLDHIIPNDNISSTARKLGSTIKIHKCIWHCTWLRKLGPQHSPSRMQIAYITDIVGSTIQALVPEFRNPKIKITLFFEETAVNHCVIKTTHPRNFLPHVDSRRYRW